MFREDGGGRVCRAYRSRGVDVALAKRLDLSIYDTSVCIAHGNKVPVGPEWFHETKQDGRRLRVERQWRTRPA